MWFLAILIQPDATSISATIILRLRQLGYDGSNPKDSKDHSLATLAVAIVRVSEPGSRERDRLASSRL